MTDESREEMHRRMKTIIESGDALTWFENLYNSTPVNLIPWATLAPTEMLIRWETASPELFQGTGQSALVVGCGTGDDAEFLSERGFDVTAFDIAPSAIALCKERFPQTNVTYQTANLLEPPADWIGHFDLVLEIYTVQALPLSMREDVFQALAALIAPGGKLLMVSRERAADVPTENLPGPPWAVSRAELDTLTDAGLHPAEFTVLEDVRRHVRFRAIYEKNNP